MVMPRDPPKPFGVGTRTLGVDFGLRRTGIAVSSGFAPVPLGILLSNRTDADFPRLASLIASAARDEGTSQIVLGMPYNSSGGEGHQAAATRRFGTILAQACAPLPVFLCDERFSTMEAQQRLHAGRGAACGEVVDSVAAAIILEDFFNDGAATAQLIGAADPSPTAAADTTPQQLPAFVSYTDIRKEMMKRAGDSQKSSTKRRKRR